MDRSAYGQTTLRATSICPDGCEKGYNIIYILNTVYSSGSEMKKQKELRKLKLVASKKVRDALAFLKTLALNSLDTGTGTV